MKENKRFPKVSGEKLKTIGKGVVTVGEIGGMIVGSMMTVFSYQSMDLQHVLIGMGLFTGSVLALGLTHPDMGSGGTPPIGGGW